MLQPLLNLDAVTLVTFGDQLLPYFENTGTIIIQIRINLLAEFVLARRLFFGLVLFIGRNRTLNVDLFRDAVGGDAGQNRCQPCLVGACLTQKVGHAESFSFHRPNTF